MLLVAILMANCLNFFQIACLGKEVEAALDCCCWEIDTDGLHHAVPSQSQSEI